MASFNVRVSEAMAARFDAWAGAHGGRSNALRHLIATSCAGAEIVGAHASPRPKRPRHLTVRLSAPDGAGLDAAAADWGFTPNAWAAALIRRRLCGRPTFGRPDAVSLIAVQAELRRIRVNVNQIARALNTAVLEKRELDLPLVAVDDLRRELRGQMTALREAFAGNLAYWDTQL